MGSISTGIGLISGINYDQLIEQMLTLDAAPRDRLTARISNIDAQRTAYLDVSARISAILAKINTLSSTDFFHNTTASSSNPDVLGVTADANAIPGSYSFIVKALATTHQVVSRGFTSQDAPLPPGQVYLESARARVNGHTQLDELNGYQGVQRGSFQITDASGNTATISLGDAVTLDDVVDRINAADIDVTAEVRADHLVLRETTGGTLRVREVDGGHVAADLGFGAGHTYDGGGRIEGTDLVYLSDYTPTRAINDGNGIRHARAGDDFTINGIAVSLSDILTPDTRLGRLNHGLGVELGTIRITTQDDAGRSQSSEIDLSGFDTIGQIKDAIEGSVEGVSVTLADNKMVITAGGDDAGDTPLTIEDVSGHAARDLGIAGTSDTGKITGSGILHSDTLADVVAAINHATDNDGSVTASIDGTRLVLHGEGGLELAAVGSSHALEDLGFAEGSFDATATGRRIVGGIDSVLLRTLNGGQGFTPGQIRIETGSGAVTLDLSDVQTLDGVIDRINQVSADEGLGIEASTDHTGTRLIVRSIDGVTPISIQDVAGGGTFAADIGLATDTPAATLTSDNLQRRYISENTALSSLNNGAGVALGTIRITNTLGEARSFDLSSTTGGTLQDVIDAINADGTFGVAARINDTGDGLVIEDTAGGDFALKIEDETGSAARDLNILGESDAGVIDGSYEFNLTLTGHETLADVAAQINDHAGIAQASVLNDGTGVSPYRLQIASSTSGAAGELLADGLDFSTLSNAQDAKVILGSNPDSGVLITSASNTISGVAPGVTIDLAAVSDDPVTVTIGRDDTAVADAIDEFVSSFNDALDRIGELSSYNPETEEKGLLLGEGTLQMVERRLTRTVATTSIDVGGGIRRLSDLGIRFRDGKLEFNRDEFLETFEQHRDEITHFFADEDTGFAAVMKKELDGITESNGLIDRRETTLEKQKELMSSRIDQINALLEQKRARLKRQFAAMESALSAMQTQQGALAQLGSLASSFGTQ